jgi:hypothetical protein
MKDEGRGRKEKDKVMCGREISFLQVLPQNSGCKPLYRSGLSTVVFSNERLCHLFWFLLREEM